MIGEVIDHYRVLELLGRGAMGVVYKALDLNLDRQVAIKVMSAEARNDPDFVERFRQEARMQGALNHPNVAQLFDYFMHEGAPVAVMEFVDGESLEQLIRRRGSIPAYECIPIFKQALRGVAAAHRAGIIHRDLKTANLMLTRDDIVKVMDFGIAKRQSSTSATKASTSIGSPLYMAPEQILGRAVDCRTDVYALGITLYQLLSGQPPFNPRGKTEYSVLSAHVNDLPEPPTVHCRNIPQPLVDVVMRALAKEPDARFQSADDFMRALPDIAPPDTAEAPVSLVGSLATPGTGPTGTVAIQRVGPTGTVAIPRVGPTGTVAIKASPALSADPVATGDDGSWTVFDHESSTRREPPSPMAFDNSAETVWQQSQRLPSALPPAATAQPAVTGNVAPPEMPVTTQPIDNSRPLSPAPSPAAEAFGVLQPSLIQRLRAHRPVFVAVLIATIVIGMMLRHAARMHANSRAASIAASSAPLTLPQPSPTTQAQASSGPAGAPPALPAPAAAAPEASSTNVTAPVAKAASAPAPVTTTAPARADLAGIWRGDYVDASGKQLLRVTSLSISRVQHDGGIEGTLQYETASGGGECKLHSRGSTYIAGDHWLQLSPEGCSPHYPKVLGVPLDFNGVNPQADTLKNGRIEAPTGEIIRVTLKRISGAPKQSPEPTDAPAHHAHAPDSPTIGRSYPSSVSNLPIGSVSAARPV
ncbi:MAG: serine/threonine-protein kinase [Steroidobacteraceae bacterium]|jgi:serine/threonine protein kinase